MIEAIRFKCGTSDDGIFAFQECQNVDPDSKIIRNTFEVVMSRDKYACLLFSKSWANRLKYKYNSLDRIAAAVFQLPSSARRVCAISCYLPDESVADAVSIYEATLNIISELMLQVRLLPGQRGRSCNVD